MSKHRFSDFLPPPARKHLLLSFALTGILSFPVTAQQLFKRGDMDADGDRNVTDAVALLTHLFLGGEEPPCLKSADADDNGSLEITDAIKLLTHLFLGDPPPPDPFLTCGEDLSPDPLTCNRFPPCEFENLIESYSILITIAGRGQIGEGGVNGWEPRFEGGPAIEAELSRPHFAMADDAGNIYIADKDAHAIRKVSPDGNIFTVAGTSVSGDDGDDPGPGTERRLSSPNGLWVQGDGTLFILDLSNGKIRRLSPSGILSTLFSVPGGIVAGRGLWVRSDEGLVYFSSGTEVKKWTTEGGVEIIAAGFAELGNLIVDPAGNLIVTDRGGNRVYRISSDGPPVPVAGNGWSSGGGDGELALETGLYGVRGIWFIPNGGYFLATHEGSQVWNVDTRGYIHLFLDGREDGHSGDGEFFYTPGYKVSEVRSVSMDRDGNVIITENDSGFIRMVKRR